MGLAKGGMKFMKIKSLAHYRVKKTLLYFSGYDAKIIPKNISR
jgi:hypothetical protein